MHPSRRGRIRWRVPFPDPLKSPHDPGRKGACSSSPHRPTPPPMRYPPGCHPIPRSAQGPGGSDLSVPHTRSKLRTGVPVGTPVTTNSSVVSGVVVGASLTGAVLGVKFLRAATVAFRLKTPFRRFSSVSLQRRATLSAFRVFAGTTSESLWLVFP